MGESAPQPRQSAPSGQLRHTLTAHEDWVLGLAIHPQRGEIASSANDHTVAIWDKESGQLLNFLQGHTGLVATVCFSKDGKSVASGSHSGQLNIWDVERGENRLMLPRPHEHGIYSLAYTPDGTMIASGAAAGAGTIQLHHSRTGQLIRVIDASPGPVFSNVFSPDGSLVAGAIGDGAIQIWQVATGRTDRVLSGHTKVVYGLAFSPDGRWLASASADTTLRLPFPSIPAEPSSPPAGMTRRYDSGLFPQGRRWPFFADTTPRSGR